MLDYHSKTAHSYQSVRMKSHHLDWDHPPKQFKYYPKTLTRILLDKNNPEHQFFYLIGGITAQKSYPCITYALRTNPSAGALYPTEIYVQIRGLEGFEDGIYHLSPYEASLVLLYPLPKDEGVESFLHVKKIRGVIFLFSALYYRSSWKYNNRAFRYCLHDTGHMVGALEASCVLHEKAYQIVYSIDKAGLNTLFGFSREEFFLCGAIVGEEDECFTCKTPSSNFLSVSGTGFFEANEFIEAAYKRSCELLLKNQPQQPTFIFDKERLREAIWKRRSIREFIQKPISKEHFLEVMHFISKPIPSDCDVEVKVYAIINRVAGMEQGIWKEGAYLQKGDFTREAGYLCLEQDLGAHSGVTFFLVGEDAKNYQAMMQKAGILGHRLYLISTYLGLGCSGIGAYYDEEVKVFLKSSGMVLYALAIGQ